MTTQLSYNYRSLCHFGPALEHGTIGDTHTLYLSIQLVKLDLPLSLFSLVFISLSQPIAGIFCSAVIRVSVGVNQLPKLARLLKAGFELELGLSS